MPLRKYKDTALNQWFGNFIRLWCFAEIHRRDDAGQVATMDSSVTARRPEGPGDGHWSTASPPPLTTYRIRVPRPCMPRALQLALLLALAATQLPAAELANLHNGYSIRHEHHETLGGITRLYLGRETNGSFVDVATSQIDSFESAPPEPDQAGPQTSTSRNLGAIIGDASSRSRIDADFIASVIHAESANNPRAVSRKGAQGLMQLMPETARNLGVKDSFDPADNVEGGVRFLRELLLRYHGDAAKALAAYNAGPYRVEQYKGVPPYRETQAYVARVISDYNRRKLAQRQPSSKLTAEPSGRASKLDTIAEKGQPNPAH